MSEFPDRRSRIGRVGALTVVGPVSGGSLGRISRGFLYSVMKAGSDVAQYSDLGDLRQLFALRWTQVRLPGATDESLIFETVFHGDWEQYLLHLIRQTSDGIDLHATRALRFPGASEVRLFLGFLLDRHRPALHVYAANPMLSPTDIDQLMPERGDAALPAERDVRWFGSLLTVKPGALSDVESIVGSWDPGTSPFGSSAVHHGRVVLLQDGVRNHILVSAVYASTTQDADPMRKAIVTKRDREFVSDLMGPGRAARWNSLLQLTAEGSDGDMSPADLLLTHRYGHHRSGPIRWADWCWRFTPDQLAERGSDGERRFDGPRRQVERPHGKPTIGINSGGHRW
jgi:hypothetical protein